MSESPTETTDDNVVITIELSQREEGSISLRPVGVRPYILLEVKDVSDDEDDLTVAIEVGGGVPARPISDLALFLAAIAESLSDYIVANEDEEVSE